MSFDTGCLSQFRKIMVLKSRTRIFPPRQVSQVTFYSEEKLFENSSLGFS